MSTIRKPFYIILGVLIFSSCSNKQGVDHSLQYNLKNSGIYNFINETSVLNYMVVLDNFEINKDKHTCKNSIPDRKINSMSLKRSILSILIGIAIDKGYIKSVNQKLSEFIDPTTENLGAQNRNLTIHQLLKMKPELNKYEPNTHFKNTIYSVSFLHKNDKPVIDLFSPSDSVEYLIKQILQQATGMSLQKFANIYFFTPLEIETKFWHEDFQGYNYSGIQSCVGPNDILKITSLFLQKGLYKNKRIVSEKWIIESSSNSYLSIDDILSYSNNYQHYHKKEMEMGYRFYNGLWRPVYLYRSPTVSGLQFSKCIW